MNSRACSYSISRYLINRLLVCSMFWNEGPVRVLQRRDLYCLVGRMLIFNSILKRDDVVFSRFPNNDCWSVRCLGTNDIFVC